MFTRQLPQKKKSCGHCVKSKRKCDLSLPTCGRCNKRGLLCEYPYAEAAIQEQQAPCYPVPSTQAQADAMLDFDIGADLHADFSSTSPNSMCLDKSVADLPSFDLLSAMPADNELGYVEPSQDITSNRGPHAGFSTASLNQWTASRLLFSMDVFRNAPKSMVQENQTPWSHYRLYDDAMPRCLSDAYAACALYLSKTEANTKYVARHLEERFDELLITPMPNTLNGVLAHAHAFILFLSLQVFSSDPRAHAQAQRALLRLEAYGYQLHTLLILDNGLDVSMLQDSLPVYPIQAASIAWRTYILHESARRTLIILFFMLSLCLALRGELRYCHEGEALSCPLLGSAHLWNASSAFEFAKAWNERDKLLVQDVNFDPMLLKAQPEDVDVFGRMMLVARLGIDDVKGWFDMKGGSFEE